MRNSFFQEISKNGENNFAFRINGDVLRCSFSFLPKVYLKCFCCKNNFTKIEKNIFFVLFFVDPFFRPLSSLFDQPISTHKKIHEFRNETIAKKSLNVSSKNSQTRFFRSESYSFFLTINFMERVNLMPKFYVRFKMFSWTLLWSNWLRSRP